MNRKTLIAIGVLIVLLAIIAATQGSLYFVGKWTYITLALVGFVGLFKPAWLIPGHGNALHRLKAFGAYCGAAALVLFPLSMTPEYKAEQAGMMAERERRVEQREQAQAAQEAKIMQAEAAAQQAASQAAAQAAVQSEKAIAAFDRYIDALESPLVQRVRYDMDGAKRQEAIITVSNLWHVRAYQIRLQDAQTLWDLWAKASTVDNIDAARISIVDLRGNEVGGSRIIAGSMIWVQD